MANPYFRFKQFTVHHDRCAMKVTTDACLFGAWAARLLADEDVKELIDIGTGTALLPLMIAQQSGARMEAVELDEAAAGQATENVTASPWNDRIRIIRSDILDFEPGKKYGAVVSNPPFYEGELAGPQVARNRAHHSSDLSLAQVVDRIDHYLDGEGTFFLLLPFKRLAEARKLLLERGLGLTRISTVRNSAAHPPFRVLLTGSRSAKGLFEETIDIRSEDGTYTPVFVSLLKDYYLYL